MHRLWGARECRDVSQREGGDGVLVSRQENSGVHGRGRPRWQAGDPNRPEAATEPGGRRSGRRGEGRYREGLAAGLIFFCDQSTLRSGTRKEKLEMKKGVRGVNPASKPSGNGCVECLASPQGWWLHLRRCAECGHIGCCDSSPSQHASRHAAATGHPIIASFEPGEDWFYDYETRGEIRGAELLPPHSHPRNQPVPGPAGRVPGNWESLLN